MTKEEITKLTKRLEVEIASTQKGMEKTESLERLKEIAEKYRGEDQVISFEEVAENIRNRGEELKIMSGWSDLDKILKGFRLKQLIVVSAPTKAGKTTFLMDLTTRIEDYNPLWFPLEEGADELITKFLERGEKPPHGYTPQTTMMNSMDWIETKIIEAIAKYNSQVVFLDQLDFIVPFNGDNHSLRVGQAMRWLKGIAKKWNIVVFLICHVVKTNMVEQPNMEDLKGSSSIGQEADTVIFLWRETKKEDGEYIVSNNLNVSVQANRRTGSTGNVKMVFENGHFIEREWRIDKQKSKDYYEELSSDIKYK